MNHLISYDISNDRLRLRIAKTLLQAGCLRLQYSVFAGSLKDSVARRLSKDLALFEQEQGWSTEDSILLLPLHQYSQDQATIFGNLPKDWDLMQGNLHTLVL